MSTQLTPSDADHWMRRARGQVRLRWGLWILLLLTAVGLSGYAAVYPNPGGNGSPEGADFSGVAQVQTGSSTGSAFLVDTRYALTAAHVAGDTESSVNLIFKDGAQVKGTVVASGYDKLQQYMTDENTVSEGATPHDWALIELDSQLPFEKTVPVMESINSVDTQSEVFAVGYPGGGQHNVSSGILSGKDNNELRTDAAIDPGHSGGLLYSAKEQLALGIIVSTPKINGQRAASVNNAVPVDLVIQKCQEEGYLDML